MKVKSICTTRRTKIVIPILWIISAAYGMPTIFIMVSEQQELPTRKHSSWMQTSQLPTVGVLTDTRCRGMVGVPGPVFKGIWRTYSITPTWSFTKLSNDHILAETLHTQDLFLHCYTVFQFGKSCLHMIGTFKMENYLNDLSTIKATKGV